MPANDLLIYRRTEELLYTIYPALKNYPKSEKFSLCQNIKENLYQLLKFISLANSVKSKRKTYLQEADGHLQTLKVLLKLSKQRRYISVNFFKQLDLEVTEINKMLVGYIKSTS